jgi:hypothetical protein
MTDQGAKTKGQPDRAGVAYIYDEYHNREGNLIALGLFAFMGALMLVMREPLLPLGAVWDRGPPLLTDAPAAPSQHHQRRDGLRGDEPQLGGRGGRHGRTAGRRSRPPSSGPTLCRPDGRRRGIRRADRRGHGRGSGLVRECAHAPPALHLAPPLGGGGPPGGAPPVHACAAAFRTPAGLSHDIRRDKPYRRMTSCST